MQIAGQILLECLLLLVLYEKLTNKQIRSSTGNSKHYYSHLRRTKNRYQAAHHKWSNKLSYWPWKKQVKF